MKINTGFQTGIDIAAAGAAKASGIETDGAMPEGFLTLEGAHPEYSAEYCAHELPSKAWDVRTRQNVADSDATFLFVLDMNSRGTRWAMKAAKGLGALYTSSS
jgi:hypothetical protein